VVRGLAPGITDVQGEVQALSGGRLPGAVGVSTRKVLPAASLLRRRGAAIRFEASAVSCDAKRPDLLKLSRS